MRNRASWACGITVFILIALLHNPSSLSADPADKDCSVTAEGQLENGDTFAGEVQSAEDGQPRGLWYHQSAKGDRFYLRKIDWVVTPIERRDRPAQQSAFYKFGGKGSWNRMEGYTFRVMAESRKQPRNEDFYSITVFGPDGTSFYNSSGYFSKGDIDHLDCNCPSPE